MLHFAAYLIWGLGLIALIIGSMRFLFTTKLRSDMVVGVLRCALCLLVGGGLYRPG